MLGFLGYDLAHRQVAPLVIHVQRDCFDPDGPAYVEHTPGIVANVNRLVDGFGVSRPDVT